MNALSTTLAYQRLVEQNAALRLLRADLAPVIAGLLTKHLGAPGTRMPAEDLFEAMEGDLEELRLHVELKQTARAYCDDWRGAGFLVRRAAVGSRGETYELSAEAHVALRFLAQIDAPRSTVTESRLVGLAAAVRQLAIDTDPDSTRRLDALHAERDRIDAEIAKVQGGELTVLDDRRALERLTDVLMQAEQIPGDFAGVRSRFDELNHDLRARILDADGGHGSVLDDVFRGVDLIESSDEGLTFTAFSSLIRDPERSASLEADLGAVLDREFVSRLDPAARRTLRTLVRELKRGSREVHEVLTEFARGLRRYVYSQEFQRDRLLRDALREALAAAVPASRQVKPYAGMDRDIELSALATSTVGELLAHDPSEYDTGETLADAETTVADFADLAAIARESEIDFAELVTNVNAVLESIGSASVGAVLQERPASQGLASVIGLLSLAAAQGVVEPTAHETLKWTGTDDVERSATVVVHTFTEKIA